MVIKLIQLFHSVLNLQTVVFLLFLHFIIHIWEPLSNRIDKDEGIENQGKLKLENECYRESTKICMHWGMSPRGSLCTDWFHSLATKNVYFCSLKRVRIIRFIFREQKLLSTYLKHKWLRFLQNHWKGWKIGSYLALNNCYTRLLQILALQGRKPNWGDGSLEQILALWTSGAHYGCCDPKITSFWEACVPKLLSRVTNLIMTLHQNSAARNPNDTKDLAYQQEAGKTERERL